MTRIHENLSLELRKFEVSVAMQAQLGAAMAGPSGSSKRRRDLGSSEVETMRMRILHMEQQRRRRKQEVGALRKALHQVRNLFADETSTDQQDLSASQLLS